jgi:hypothetical protein
MRIHHLRANKGYEEFACKIADIMPRVGMDRQRGGWYDMAERLLGPGEEFHRLIWHDRKAWWQQEQGILAYLILGFARSKMPSTCAWRNPPPFIMPGSRPRLRRRVF